MEQDFDKLYVIATHINHVFHALPKEFPKIKTNSNNNIKIHAIILVLYKITVIYDDLIDLLKNTRIQSSAVLLRTLLECLGNANWIITERESQNRANKFINSALIVDKYVSGINNNTTINGLGYVRWTNISTEKRIRSADEGWIILYRHLCSFSHGDAGYLSHILRKETYKLQSLWMIFAITIMIEFFKTLHELSLTSEDSEKKLQKVKDAFNDLLNDRGIKLP